MADRTLGEHHLGHLVCTSCGQLRSIDPDPDRPDCDTCRCAPDRDPAYRELQVPCRICAACGLAIAAGHTRWRLNFCVGCRSDFVQLRAMLGWSHIPLGLHSLVNRTGTLTSEAFAAISESPAAERLLDRRATQLATELTKMVGGIDRLYAHVDRLTGERLIALGLTDEPAVPWPDYAQACRDAAITDDDGWAALLREFSLGDWIGDVQTYRHSRNVNGRGR